MDSSLCNTPLEAEEARAAGHLEVRKWGALAEEWRFAEIVNVSPVSTVMIVVNATSERK